MTLLAALCFEVMVFLFRARLGSTWSSPLEDMMFMTEIINLRKRKSYKMINTILQRKRDTDNSDPARRTNNSAQLLDLNVKSGLGTS